jgi:hypothetical protein
LAVISQQIPQTSADDDVGDEESSLFKPAKMRTRAGACHRDIGGGLGYEHAFWAGGELQQAAMLSGHGRK